MQLEQNGPKMHLFNAIQAFLIGMFKNCTLISTHRGCNINSQKYRLVNIFEGLHNSFLVLHGEGNDFTGFPEANVHIYLFLDKISAAWSSIET